MVRPLVAPPLDRATSYAPHSAENVSKWIAKIEERRKRFRGFIPNVIWTIVMSMLVADDLINLAKVSRQLHHIASLPECWQGRGLLIAKYPKLVEHSVEAKVVSNSFLKIKRTVQFNSNSSCNFNAILIDGYSSNVADDTICNILRCSLGIRHLSLTMRLEASILEMLQQTRLESLSLNGNYNTLLVPYFRDVFLAQAGSLKSLRIINYLYMNTMPVLETLSEILDRFHVLKSLDITLSLYNSSLILDKGKINHTLGALGKGLAANSSIEKLTICANSSGVTDVDIPVLLEIIAQHSSIRTLHLEFNLPIPTIRETFAGSNLSEVSLGLSKSPVTAMGSFKPHWASLRKLHIAFCTDDIAQLFVEPWMPNLEELVIGTAGYDSHSLHCGRFYELLESLRKGCPKLRSLDLLGISTRYHDAYTQLYRAAFDMAMRLLASHPDLVIKKYPCSTYWYQSTAKHRQVRSFEPHWGAYDLEELQKIALEYEVGLDRLDKMLYKPNS
jgi:hypothetical protein